MKLKIQNNRASITLISLLIVSVFTLIFAVTMSEVNIGTAYQALNHQSGRSSYYLAEACLEEALYRLEADATFDTATLVFDADQSCTISASGAGPVLVDITVNYFEYVETYQATVDFDVVGEVNNAELTLWEEI